MNGQLYTSGEYLERNPTWHVEDYRAFLKKVRTRVAHVPRRAVSILHPYLAARVFGGFSLMVLAT